MAEYEYQYAAWAEETSQEAQLAMLNKHISEVSKLMLPDSSGTDHSVSIKSLQAYHKTLMEARKDLVDFTAQAGFNPLQRVRRVRG